MDIYIEPGTKVRFLNENGYDFELKEAQAIFEEGKEYTVSNIDVGSWKSSVSFEEVEGRFNTVMFTEV